MAAALVDYARSRSVEPRPEDVDEFQNFPGEGIHGKIDGKYIHIGNKKIAIRAGCGTVQSLETETRGGSTTGNIYLDGTCIGFFNLSDACRSGVVEAIEGLKSLSIRSSMLTGDNHAAAKHIQDQLGNALDEVHAELLPEDKARIIREFQKQGRTAMVGDGLNDALALATADIGISMGISGSALATDTGHVILMSNDIGKIPKAVKLARRCRRKVIENVVLSFVPKAAVLALACTGHPLVSVAVLADVGTCLLVILNSSMLLLGGENRHRDSTNGEKSCERSHHNNSFHNHHHHHHGRSELSIADQKTATRCEPKECSSQSCGCQPSTFISSSCRRKICTQRRAGEGDLSSCGLNGKFHQTSCEHRTQTEDEHSQCKKHTENSENFDQTASGHHPESTQDGHPECKPHTQNSSTQQQFSGAMDNAKLGNVLHACMSLDKREMGGCCKSFREECCGKHGNTIGGGFGGGLSEIITE